MASTPARISAVTLLLSALPLGLAAFAVVASGVSLDEDPLAGVGFVVAAIIGVPAALGAWLAWKDRRARRAGHRPGVAAAVAGFCLVAVPATLSVLVLLG